MVRGAYEVKSSRIAVTSQRASAYIIGLMALVLSGCSFGDIPSPDGATDAPMNSQRDRYMQACAQRETKDMRGRQVACECVFDFAEKRLNQIELEMLIANSGQDKKKQEEIRARPDYNQVAFGKKMKALVEGATACNVGKDG